MEEIIQISGMNDFATSQSKVSISDFRRSNAMQWSYFRQHCRLPIHEWGDSNAIQAIQPFTEFDRNPSMNGCSSTAAPCYKWMDWMGGDN